MTTILPSAQNLAEANGIDWYALRGTGEGGIITEGDVLTHLAAIMMGDIDAPLTPVDAPPPEWNGTLDLNPEMLQAAGMDQDTLRMVGEAAESMRQASAAELVTEPEPAPEAPPVQPVPTPIPAQPPSTEPVLPTGNQEAPPKSGLSGLLGRIYGRQDTAAPPSVPAASPVLPQQPVSAPPTPLPTSPATGTAQERASAVPAVAASQAAPAQAPAAPAPGVPEPIRAPESVNPPEPAPVAVTPTRTVTRPATAPSAQTWRGAFMRRSCPATAYSDFKFQIEQVLGTEPGDALLIAHAAQRVVGTIGREEVTYLQGERTFATDLSLRRAVMGGVPAPRPGDVLVSGGNARFEQQPGSILLVADVHDDVLSLSLLGEVGVQEGAAFLAAIGNLLQRPVALLL